MFRHVVMFRWKPETPAEAVAEVADRLGDLPAVIPQLRAYRLGSDAGVNAGNFDFVVVADFDSADDYVSYRDNEAHRSIADTMIAPLVADRAAVQYEC